VDAEGSKNRLADAIGPFYSASGVAAWLNLQETDVEDRVRNRELFGCVTADTQLLLPSAQFNENGSTHPGLHQILDVLATGTSDAWTWGLWLFSRVPGQLDGMSVMEWLKNERDVDAVLLLARNDANSWSA